MQAYPNLVSHVLQTGNYKKNRTGVDTISSFSEHYRIDLSEGYPLLTTKKMDGFRWDSMLYELCWYLDGEHHIRNLREHTKIWDAWADEDYNLPSAYGRFWRRYPIPDRSDRLNGETWAEIDAPWVDDAAEAYNSTREEINNALERWINLETNGRKTFDQLQYVIDTLNEDNPMRGPNSRRLIINAWHPANAAVSDLPPCHFTFVFNVQGDRLNVHLTQRSGDVALGIPFNIAAYSLLAKAVAQQTGFKPGEFSHTIVDAHVYAGKGERGEWYGNNLDELHDRMAAVTDREEYLDVRDWLLATAPEEADDEEKHDHVPGLLKQLSRQPQDRPTIEIADKPVTDLEYDDITLTDYDSHDGLKFAVAE